MSGWVEGEEGLEEEEVAAPSVLGVGEGVAVGGSHCDVKPTTGVDDAVGR